MPVQHTCVCVFFVFLLLTRQKYLTLIFPRKINAFSTAYRNYVCFYVFIRLIKRPQPSDSVRFLSELVAGLKDILLGTVNY